MEIELTVGLPMFNCKHIGWLALESLCGQISVDFGWELIVCEEQDEYMFGSEEVAKFEERLRQVNCLNIRYISIDEWIVLSRKWKIIADKMASTSRVLFPVAGDNYLPPTILSEIHEIFQDKSADWTQVKKGWWLDLLTHKYYLFDHDHPGYKHPVSINFAINSRLTKNLVPMNSIRSNDSWLYKQAIVANAGKPLNVCWNNSDSWQHALWTRGLNNLSSPQGNFRGQRISAPWVEIDIDIKQYIPKDIVDRLLELKQYVPNHEAHRKPRDLVARNLVKPPKASSKKRVKKRAPKSKAKEAPKSERSVKKTVHQRPRSYNRRRPLRRTPRK